MIIHSKNYSIEKVETVVSEIQSAPSLPAKILNQEQVLKKLTKEIRVLHTKKNYSASNIVALLKEKGIKVTVREVKNILDKTTKKQTVKKHELVQNK